MIFQNNFRSAFWDVRLHSLDIPLNSSPVVITCPRGRQILWSSGAVWIAGACHNAIITMLHYKKINLNIFQCFFSPATYSYFEMNWTTFLNEIYCIPNSWHGLQVYNKCRKIWKYKKSIPNKNICHIESEILCIYTQNSTTCVWLGSLCKEMK